MLVGESLLPAAMPWSCFRSCQWCSFEGLSVGSAEAFDFFRLIARLRHRLFLSAFAFLTFATGLRAAAFVFFARTTWAKVISPSLWRYTLVRLGSVTNDPRFERCALKHRPKFGVDRGLQVLKPFRTERLRAIPSLWSGSTRIDVDAARHRLRPAPLRLHLFCG